MNAYTIIESELDFLGSSGTAMTLYLWACGVGVSLGVSTLIAAQTTPLPWQAPELALFEFGPWVGGAIGLLFGILSGVEIYNRRAAVKRIKDEHKARAEVRALSPD